MQPQRCQVKGDNPFSWCAGCALISAAQHAQSIFITQREHCWLIGNLLATRAAWPLLQSCSLAYPCHLCQCSYPVPGTTLHISLCWTSWGSSKLILSSCWDRSERQLCVSPDNDSLALPLSLDNAVSRAIVHVTDGHIKKYQTQYQILRTTIHK